MELAVIVVLAILAFGVITIPIMRGGGAATDGMSGASVEEEIARYRAAVRADTVCRRCGQANPAGSRFCSECGRPLSAVDAEEFEGTGEAA
jgi:hypothetical protein